MISEEQILNAKILVVDDNILNIHIIKKILTESGYVHIVTTTESTKAFDIYKELQPDLALLDFNMPGLNGIELMHQFVSLDPGGYLPVLMLSAEEDPNLRIKALQSGAKDFLKKPFDRLEVLSRSRNIIEVRMLYNQMKTQNHTLEECVESRTKELQQTRLDVVCRLARVAEFRDTETGQHIVRMSHYAKKMAEAAGFPPAQCELILNTSPLHDIGKIAIPDSILLKPGKLDPEEYEIMKTHTTLGAKMLAGAESVFLTMAETIAISHHEKFDGTGYPNKLKGEEIPLVGRICAISDVFDALTSKRCYKKAWGLEDAFEEMRSQRGKHFDPHLIDAFFDIRKDIEYIYSTHQ